MTHKVRMTYKHMRSPAIMLVALAVGSCPIAAQVQADVTSATSTIISLGGQQIMDIRTGAGSYTARQRANVVRERLIPILSITHLKPNDISVRQSGPKQAASIYVRGHLLITVDRLLAQANHMKPGTLAHKWASSLAAVLPQVDVRRHPQGI